jgi:tRNA A37 threonylcarbamoyladenosine dehydratase
VRLPRVDDGPARGQAKGAPCRPPMEFTDRVTAVAAVSGACGAAVGVLTSLLAPLAFAKRGSSAVDPAMHFSDALDCEAQTSLDRAIRHGANVASLKAEQLSRNRQFFDDDGQDRIESSFVVVVGLGGVGSHAANMLVRAGIRRIRLVDFDNVSMSSLNRHATATRADVGTPKVVALAKHLARVCPWCEIEPVAEMFSGERADVLLAGTPDLVIDAIDDTVTKAQLLLACARLDLDCVSSLGAGGKSDPTRIHVSSLDASSVDPLSPKLRYVLKQQAAKLLGVVPSPFPSKIQDATASEASEEKTDTQEMAEAHAAAAAARAAAAADDDADDDEEEDAGVATTHKNKSNAAETTSGKAEEEADPVMELVTSVLQRTLTVYSSETAVKKLLPLADEQAQSPGEFGLIAGFRLRVIPVLGAMPALFGQAISSVSLCKLANKPIRAPIAGPHMSHANLSKIVSRLYARETKVHGEVRGPEMFKRVDCAVVDFHIQRVWEGSCALNAVPKGKRANLVFSRWDMTRPACRDNLIYADIHGVERLEKEGHGWLSDEQRMYVEGRLAWVRALESANMHETVELGEAFQRALEQSTAGPVAPATAVPARAPSNLGDLGMALLGGAVVGLGVGWVVWHT